MDFFSVPGEIVNPSGVMLAFRYIPAHAINEKSRIVQSLVALIDLLVPSFELLKIAAAGILAYGILFYSFSFCLWKFFKKPMKTNLQIQILAFAYLIFLFFIDEIYNACISTQSVTGKYSDNLIKWSSLIQRKTFNPLFSFTVDISDLLHSDEQILGSKKTPCFFEGETVSLYCSSSLVSHPLSF